MKMHKYFISNGTVEILPKIKENTDFRENTKVLEQSSKHTISRTEYPNGLIMETHNTIEGATITTNWIIAKGEKGNYYIVEPIQEIE